MADGKSRNKQRLVRHTACFTSIENALLMTRVDIACMSISSYLRTCALDYPVTKGVRRPATDQEQICRLIGELGTVATAFRSATLHAPPNALDSDAVMAALDTLSEMRLLCFDALGRKP